jgi:hypothetical protein
MCALFTLRNLAIAAIPACMSSLFLINEYNDVQRYRRLDADRYSSIQTALKTDIKAYQHIIECGGIDGTKDWIKDQESIITDMESGEWIKRQRQSIHGSGFADLLELDDNAVYDKREFLTSVKAKIEQIQKDKHLKSL